MIGLEKFMPSERDIWCWDLARFEDIVDIVNLTQTMCEADIDMFFTPDPPFFARNLAIAVSKQAYNRYDEQLIAARHKETKKLMAWAWLSRGSYTTYSRDEMAEARFAQIDLTLPVRTRITLLAQILQQWYAWATICRIPVLASNSIREDQVGFMNLHRAAGFTIRGSTGYLKI